MNLSTVSDMYTLTSVTEGKEKEEEKIELETELETEIEIEDAEEEAEKDAEEEDEIEIENSEEEDEEEEELEIELDPEDDDELETLEEVSPKSVYFRSSLEAHKKHLSLVSKQLHEKNIEVLAEFKKYKKSYTGDMKLLFFSFAGHWRRTGGITEWIKIILSTMSETIAQAKITGVGPVIYEKKMDGKIYSQKTMELVRTFAIIIAPSGKAQIMRM